MERSYFTIATGYHEFNFPPPVAYDHGLRERFAVVLGTLTNDDGDMLFESQLFLSITQALLKAIPHDAIELRMGDRYPLHSFANLATWYSILDAVDREPPDSIVLTAASSMTAYVDFEHWANCGGPSFYHDSHTVSFYTRENRASEFRDLCEHVAASYPADMKGFYEALPRKEPFFPNWKRPLKWLGFKVW